MVTPEETLLGLVRCPLSGQPLRLASTEEAQSFPALKAGQAAVIRQDGQVIYPVENGIPLLIPEEAISRSSS